MFDPGCPRLKKGEDVTPWIRTAQRIALRHDFGPGVKYKHAALIISGSRVLGRGFNRPKKNVTIERLGHRENLHVHAEIDAIAKIKGTVVNKSKMVVVRIGNRGELKMSLPCAMCRKEAFLFGAKEIWFSVSEDSWGKLLIGGRIVFPESAGRHA